MVIWLVGLSGSGKTTIGRGLYNYLKEEASNTVMVDGDEVRKIFSQDQKPADYTLEGRRINAKRILEICKWLDKQNINVICCILSIFTDIQLQNKTEFSKYFEIYIDVPFEILAERDDKGIYAPAIEGKTHNVVGVDIPFPQPISPDMVIDNSRFDIDPKIWAKRIFGIIKQ
jgi:cytidine diphosphoramidate kinase